MHRLFVGLPLPPPVRDACLAAAEDCPAHWAMQTEAQLHLTVRFIGEVDRHRAEDVADALARVRLVPLRIGIGGVGYFDHGRHGALFARAIPREPLDQLHQRVDRALVGVGLEPERRAYLPHVTLARARRGAEPPQPWLERFASLMVKPVAAGRMLLLESHLGRTGASYEVVDSFPIPSGDVQ